jgi:PTH1 family peptidyl-tRNA hydrolase
MQKKINKPSNGKDTEIRLLAFLGNPGKEYEKTRHNIAWLAAKRFSFYASLVWQEKWKGRYAVFSGENPPGRLILLMPQTFMNLSGSCVQACMDFFKIKPEELLVVHDEIELPFGTAGFKKGGGLGGHNGLRSIQKSLSSADFWRFRLGVGRPPSRFQKLRQPEPAIVKPFQARGNVSSFVLGRFSPEEEPLLDIYLKQAAAILLACAANPEDSAAVYGKTSILKT